MFLGHYALGLPPRSAAPRTSLGTLTMAANLADEVWPILLVLGVEHVRIVPGLLAASPFDFTDYPWSHSLLTGALAGLVFAAIYFMVRRYGRGALVLGGLVVSHWLIDLFFHRPDLPLWPGGPKFGFGLWGSLPVTVICEFVFFAIRLWLYQRATVAVDKIGSIALWAQAAISGGHLSRRVVRSPPESQMALRPG